MRTSSDERGTVHPRVVVLCGALIGTLAGLGLPGIGRTWADFTSQSTVEAVVSVLTCSHAWADHVAASSPSLHWSFERYTTQTGIAVSFTHSGMDRRFLPAIEISAYRILQEALTNVARHAGVRDVAVRVLVADNAIYLHIEDCGRGFDMQALLQNPVSSGLTGLYERATLIGGSLHIESKSGKGTRLSAELPLGKI